MRSYLLALLTAVAVGLMAASCEKADFGGSDEQPEVKDGVTVRLSVAGFEQFSFDDGDASTRAPGSIKDVCSRLTFGIYYADGKVYHVVNQQSGDKTFGSLTISLPKGSYKIIVMAHSSDGAPTFETWEKVKFKDNKTTDTFCAVKDIDVDDGGSYSLELKRCVAMFRLVVNDEIPSSVASMKFYYTGGSSTLNPITGFGCVNSRQTEIREVTASMRGKGSAFEVYSFPHAEEDELKITVSALDASGATLLQKTFDNVPIRRNMITQYKGNFFDGSSGGGGGDDDDSITFDISFDDTWSTITHSY